MSYQTYMYTKEILKNLSVTTLYGEGKVSFLNILCVSQKQEVWGYTGLYYAMLESD